MRRLFLICCIASCFIPVPAQAQQWVTPLRNYYFKGDDVRVIIRDKSPADSLSVFNDVDTTVHPLRSGYALYDSSYAVKQRRCYFNWLLGPRTCVHTSTLRRPNDTADLGTISDAGLYRIRLTERDLAGGLIDTTLLLYAQSGWRGKRKAGEPSSFIDPPRFNTFRDSATDTTVDSLLYAVSNAKTSSLNARWDYLISRYFDSLRVAVAYPQADKNDTGYRSYQFAIIATSHHPMALLVLDDALAGRRQAGDTAGARVAARQQRALIAGILAKMLPQLSDTSLSLLRSASDTAINTTQTVSPAGITPVVLMPAKRDSAARALLSPARLTACIDALQYWVSDTSTNGQPRKSLSDEGFIQQEMARQHLTIQDSFSVFRLVRLHRQSDQLIFLCRLRSWHSSPAPAGGARGGVGISGGAGSMRSRSEPDAKARTTKRTG